MTQPELQYLHHLQRADELLQEAESRMRPGNTFDSIQEPLIKAHLELMKALSTATRIIIELTTIPPRVVFMEDL
jgi:hypothetical protein